MALDNDERSQNNALLKQHGYRWTKENNQWILKDPQGKTTTAEKALQSIKKQQKSVSTPAATPVNLSERPAILRWAQQIVRRHPLILDIETTNIATIDEITELAIVNIAGQVIFSSQVKPGQPVRATMDDIEKLPTSTLTQAPTFPEIWNQIYPLLIQNELIIYHAAFQLRVLRQTASRYQLALPAIVSHCMMGKYALYAGVKATERDYQTHSLEDACSEFGISTGTQRASDKAEATRQLLLVLANISA